MSSSQQPENPEGIPDSLSGDVDPDLGAPDIQTKDDLSQAQLLKSTPTPAGDSEASPRSQRIADQILESLVPAKWRAFRLVESGVQDARNDRARKAADDAALKSAKLALTAAIEGADKAKLASTPAPRIETPEEAAVAQAKVVLEKLEATQANELEARTARYAPLNEDGWLARHIAAIKHRIRHTLSIAVEDPRPFQVLDVLAWQQNGGEMSSIGWLLKAQQAEAVSRMRWLRCIAVIVGTCAAVLTLSAALVAVASVAVVVSRTGIVVLDRKLFYIPANLWQYSLASTSAVLLCLAAATLLFRASLALFADSAAAFLTADSARRAEAALRLMRYAGSLTSATDPRVRQGLVDLGLEFGRRTQNAPLTTEEIGIQIREGLDIAEKVKNLAK